MRPATPTTMSYGASTSTVTFTGCTSAGRLREAVVKGVRADAE